MALLRGLLEIAQDGTDVRPLGRRQQPIVQIAVGDLCGHSRLAGLPKAVIAFDLPRPRVARYSELVAPDQGQQSLDVTGLRLADVAEGPNLAEVGDYLIVGGPG